MNEFVFSEIETGYECSFSKEITVEMEQAFREITGDVNPLHQDDEYAVSVGGGKFRQHVSFGMLTASLLSTVAGVYLPGKYSLIHSIDKISFKNPVFAGDVLTVSSVVEGKQDDLKLLQLKVTITNQDHKCVARAGMKVLVLK